VFAILDQLMDHEVPYLSFSGGEPMLHPLFFKMVEHVCSRGTQLKIETNGHYLTVENCECMKALGVKAVQVSLDGASAATFNRMRVRGNFDTTLDGLRNLRAAGVPVEINFSPAGFNAHAIGEVVDLAYELGAYSFYTGRTMFTGNAVKAWRHLELSDERYAAFFDILRARTEEYRGRMRVYFHEAGLLEELRYRLQHPAALLIVLPNGLVKLINALPFVCGDFRRQSLPEIWPNFRRAWHDPRVAQFVDNLAADPGKTRTLHQWVCL
jgi:MoaA/NifB/PqqE/SkfB family radical SAM enzyme